MRGALLLIAAPLFAADDAGAILQRLVEAQKRNGDRIQPYTYTEEGIHFTYSKDGKLKRDYSEILDVIFLEGYPFHKLISRNNKPLPPKEQAEIDQSMKETAEERRKRFHPPPGGQLIMGGRRIDVGANRELLMLFDSRVTGEEEIRGRKTWVVEALPKPNYAPASDHERDVLSFRRMLWIDQEEAVPVRILLTVVGDGISFAKAGSSLRIDYAKIAPDVWCESGAVLDIWRAQGKEFKPGKRTEYTDSNFHKFDVQSTVTVDKP
ncbi:MAG TPA: hypothetical protein VHW24_18675 [Bryobacteraceae bacterium]|nr:hypothetical protein [Bryobacteraceae bacterium]